MQLNNLIIETRLRTAWSSIDLGLALGRMFWLRAFFLYLLVAMPVFALTRLLDDSYVFLPYVILWWCKPIFERPILFFMSRLYYVEQIFSIALLMLFYIFFPEQIDISLAWLNELRENNTYVDFGSLLMMAAIAPFYVAAGFMLYISRRVELEGWDIEICFRDWMANYRSPSAREAQGNNV